jgi:hypothetical protein
MCSYMVDDEGAEDVHTMYTATYTPTNPDSTGFVDVTVVSRYPEDSEYSPSPADTFRMLFEDVTTTSCTVGPDFDEDGIIDAGNSMTVTKSGSATASLIGTWGTDADIVDYMEMSNVDLKAGASTTIDNGRYISVYTIDNEGNSEYYMHSGTISPTDPDDSFTLTMSVQTIMADGGSMCPGPGETFQMAYGDIWGSTPITYTDTDSSDDAGYMEMDVMSPMNRQLYSMPSPVGTWSTDEEQDYGDGFVIESGAVTVINANGSYNCSYIANDDGDPVTSSHSGTYTMSGYTLYPSVTESSGYAPEAGSEFGWILWTDSAGTTYMGVDTNDPPDGVVDNVIEVTKQ